MSKEISSEEYEVALDREREEFFELEQAFYTVMEVLASRYGIPFEKFDEEWAKFISKLDEHLVENFSLDRDPEDMP